ncbi:PEGA domain-containing protein [Polycyclovorans algicola]|uniref:PEGA domain-containing protein n=1 Tax=Polycyclovorans algicola TaxID=616992 RepID=UPI001267DA00|nr:PEGA domain-containing protein [Polycyclovorans algicola]
MKIKMVSAVASVLLLNGCATIVTGSTQDITILSEPSGATVTRNGASYGVTPLTLNLKRKESPSFVLRRQGFEDTILHPGKGSNGWVWGNILVGGLIGLAVDMGTGSLSKFDQDTYVVRLPREPMSPAATLDRQGEPSVSTPMRTTLTEGEGLILSTGASTIKTREP